jgi:hypothetical protein
MSRATCSASDIGKPTAMSARAANAAKSLAWNRCSADGVWVIVSGFQNPKFEYRNPKQTKDLNPNYEIRNGLV